MERIKKAIEEAQKSKENRSGVSETMHTHAQSSRITVGEHNFRLYIIKIIVASLLIIFAGWLWMHFDFRNKLELMASEYISDGLRQSRNEAKRRLESEAKFKQLVSDYFAHCQAAAERERDSSVSLVRDAIRKNNSNTTSSEKDKLSKANGDYIVPKAVLIEANEMMETSKFECQQIFEMQLKKGT